jgi:lactoylglutathione lyase
MIQRIATVAVYVDDQNRALEFWTKKAGFELRRDTPMSPEARWIEVVPPGAESALVIYPKALMPNWEEVRSSIVFLCDDVHATYEAMKRSGVNFLEEPKTMQWGTFVQFTDEDGNRFLLKS